MVNIYNRKEFPIKWFFSFKEFCYCFWISGILFSYFFKLISWFINFKFLDLNSFDLKGNLFTKVPYKMRIEHAGKAVFINKL